MTPARPHGALLRLALAALILVAGMFGGASAAWTGEDPDEVAAVELEVESKTQPDPETEDDDDDDDDDALAHGRADAVASTELTTPRTTNELTHPAHGSDPLLRPPIA